MQSKALAVAGRPLPRRLIATVAASCLLLAVPSVANAIEPRVSAQAKAEAVVTGKVLSVRSAWDRSHKLIYTYARIQVQRELKGNVPEYVTVKEPGGRIGTLRLIVSDEAVFAPGEQVQVALSREASESTLEPGVGAKKHIGGTLPQPATADAGYSWDGTKWAASDLPVPYWTNTSFTYAESSVILTSFSTWQDDPDSSMEYEYKGTTSRSGPSYDGYNVMAKGPTAGSIATTYYWFDDATKQMLDVDIVFDYDAWSWSTTGEAGKFDLENIATHESGHTLVLSDLYDSGSVDLTMYGYAIPGETKKRTLEAGDRAGIAAIYPELIPPNVTGLTATPGDGNVLLAWTNPVSPRFSDVVIMRKEGSAPASLTDGTQIYVGAGGSWTDLGLTNGVTYYYRAYSTDGAGRYSSGVVVSATPLHVSVLSAGASYNTVLYQNSTTIFSSLTPTLTPPPTLTLWKSTNGSSWSYARTMVYDGERYAGLVYPGGLTYYRTTWSGDGAYLNAASVPILVRVKPKLVVGLSTLSLPYGTTMRVSGYVYPRHDGRKVAFYWERYAGGAWTHYASKYAYLTRHRWSRSKATSSYRPTARGSWRVRFRSGDSDHTTGEKSVPFTVR